MILLITGGTGSFGNAVLDAYINDERFHEIRIFSRDEKKQDDMRHRLNNPKVNFYIGDVRDPNSIDNAMVGVNYVFHAAALKQVPSCEFYPMEAVKTNVNGTENVLNSAIRNNVDKVVCLSTDKAAYPINAMGISKAMMEKVALAKARVSKNTEIMVTRYGNVMASRGSVIPLFVDQILSKQPLTITNSDMTRFMMTLTDAVDLVFYAFENGKSGELFVQKSPAATIGDLARALAELFDVDLNARILGTRHGEKLYETLLTSEERIKAVDLGDYYKVAPDNRGLNYKKYFSEGNNELSLIEDFHSHNAARLTVEEMKNLLSTLPYLQEYL